MSVIGILVGLSALWYALFAMSPYDVDQKMIEQAYHYPLSQPDITFTRESDELIAFRYTSFDGAIVNGRLAYPPRYRDMTTEQLKSVKMPVMLGIHAMGRSDNRWFMDSFKERPTLEQTDKLTQQALKKGYAVIAIDARNHGQRKLPDYTVRDVMLDVHIWGKREPYESMIIDTVRDYRVLLDWIEQQPQFDQSRTTAAGYSMGAQVALLLGSVDDRIEQILSIVPPYLDNKTAIVALNNFVPDTHAEKVWLVTANDDEYASVEENNALFSLISAPIKKHIQLDGDHILPEGYYTQLTGWFE